MSKMKGLLVKTRNELSESKKKESEYERTFSELQTQLQEERQTSEEAKVRYTSLFVSFPFSF